jgi:Sec7-like guanine-nucleotide exchange factor
MLNEKELAENVRDCFESLKKAVVKARESGLSISINYDKAEDYIDYDCPFMRSSDIIDIYKNF